MNKNKVGKLNTCIWIRADANEEIASGHLMRMLSVAAELEKLGAAVRFVLADETSLKWMGRLTEHNAEELDASGRKTSILNIPYGHPMKELTSLAELLEQEIPDWILVDSYAVTAEWFNELRNVLGEHGADGTRIAYMDDMMAFDPPVNLVINYDPDTAELEKFYHRSTMKLLGAQYAPLREQFTGVVPVVRGVVKRILISTGGTDPYGMGQLLEETVRDAAPDVLMQTEIVHMGPGYPRVENVAELLTSCDLAISAAGTTLYELCAAGVPTMTFSMSDNQKLFAQKMAAAGAVSYLGDVREEATRAKIMDIVTDWLRNRMEESDGRTQNKSMCLQERTLAAENGNETVRGQRLRQEESERMHVMTDGRGSRRIAAELCGMIKRCPQRNVISAG